MKSCVRKINGELRYCLLLDVSGVSLRDQEEMISSFSKFQRMNIEPLPNKRETPHAILNRYQNLKN